MKRIIIIIGVIVIVGGGIFGFVQYRNNQTAQALLEDLQTVEAEMGSLIATVGATGTVRANQTAVLTWKTSGIVGELYAFVGQTANQGDRLADLVQTSLSQNIILAESELINAEKALNDLGDGYDTLALARAFESVAEAEKRVNDAKQYLYNVESPATQESIDQAESTLVLAQDRAEKAQEDWDRWENSDNDVLVATMQGNLASARSAHDSALYRYNSLIGGSTQIDIDNASADLTLAEALLENSKSEYERLLVGPTEADQSAAEARVAAVQATLNTVFIEAPFTGIITIAEPKTGDLVNIGTSAFRIDDLTHLLVDVQISEVDINRIEEGQSVVLTFDAIFATEYQGQVLEVSRVGISNQGLVNFNVTIELLDVDDQVKPGMTSGVNIIVSQLDDVLLVPNRAVRVEDGMRVVYILTGDGADEIAMVEVVLGPSSDLNSQVVNGDLKAGDLIILNPPTNIFDFTPGGGGTHFPGGGF